MAEFDEPLSDREQEVLELLAQGSSNKEIAANLFISPNTVKVHLRNINTKLGSRSRTEASRIALERGLVVIPGMEPVEAEPEVEADSLAVPVPNVEADHQTIEVRGTENAVQEVDDSDVHAKKNGANLSQTYLIGGLALVIALLGVIAWFVFNPRIVEVGPDTGVKFEPEDRGDFWFTSQRLPESLSAASAVAVGTDVYLIGGRQADGEINDELHVYDSIAHTWSKAATKPQPVVNSSAAELQGQVFVIGGVTADGKESDTVRVYSPSEDRWSFAASLPKSISNGLVATDGDQLYHLGGEINGSAIADVFLFDLATESWDTLPEMPEGRTGATGGVVNGFLYVIGGEDEMGEATASCFKFSLIENSWDSCSPMGNSRVEAGGTVIQGKLYIVGGETGADFGELYNPSSDTWEQIIEPMLEGLDSPSWTNAGIARVGTRLYAFGGEYNGTMSRDAFYFSPLVYQSFIPSASSGNNADN